MKPSDFVFNQVYKQLKAQGCPERIAHREAVQCLNTYTKGNLGGGKVSHLIAKHIKQGMKDAKAQIGAKRLKDAEASFNRNTTDAVQ